MRLKIFLFIILSFICSSHLFANENKSFSLPKENWGVVVDLSGFSVINNSFGNNGNERDITIEAGVEYYLKVTYNVYASNTATSLTLNIENTAN